jgi:hypothetical protein
MYHCLDEILEGKIEGKSFALLFQQIFSRSIAVQTKAKIDNFD